VKRALCVIVVLGLAAGLAACGEREQIVEPQSEKRYQGKRDGKAWENEPLAGQPGGKWTRGDRSSWETQIKTRQLAQHEDKRIYQ
jgi:hypothetical protein